MLTRIVGWDKINVLAFAVELRIISSYPIVVGIRLLAGNIQN